MWPLSMITLFGLELEIPSHTTQIEIVVIPRYMFQKESKRFSANPLPNIQYSKNKELVV